MCFWRNRPPERIHRTDAGWNRHGWGLIRHGWSPIRHGWGPIRHGWSPIRHGWSPIRHGWSPICHGWGPIRHGWGLIRCGWRPILHGWGLIRRGWTQSHRGFPPAQAPPRHGNSAVFPDSTGGSVGGSGWINDGISTNPVSMNPEMFVMSNDQIGILHAGRLHQPKRGNANHEKHQSSRNSEHWRKRALYLADASFMCRICFGFRAFSCVSWFLFQYPAFRRTGGEESAGWRDCERPMAESRSGRQGLNRHSGARRQRRAWPGWGGGRIFFRSPSSVFPRCGG